MAIDLPRKILAREIKEMEGRMHAIGRAAAEAEAEAAQARTTIVGALTELYQYEAMAGSAGKMEAAWLHPRPTANHPGPKPHDRSARLSAQVKNFAEVFNDRLLSARGVAAAAPEETPELESQRRETERLRAEVAGLAGMRAQLFTALAAEDAARGTIEELRAELSEATTALRSGAAELSISHIRDNPLMTAADMAQVIIERGIDLEGSARHVMKVVDDEFTKASSSLRSLERKLERWPGAEEDGVTSGGDGGGACRTEQLQHASACLDALGSLQSRLAEEMQAGPASFQTPLTPQSPLLPLLETRGHPHAFPAFPASHYQKHAVPGAVHGTMQDPRMPNSRMLDPRSDSSSLQHLRTAPGRARRPAPPMGRPPRPSHHLMPISASTPHLGLKAPPRTTQSAQWQGGTHGNRMVAPWTPEGSPGSDEMLRAGGLSLHQEGAHGRSCSSLPTRPPAHFPAVSGGLRGGTQSAMPVRPQPAGPPAPSRTVFCDTSSPASPR